LEQDRIRIENELEAVMTERQWVITQARKGAFTTNDMEYQISQLTFQEVTLKHELTTLGETININALNNWEENVSEFLANLITSVEELKIAAPHTSEEQLEIFVLKRRVIDTLVEHIEINRDRNLFVQIRLNPLDILRKDAESGGSTAGVQNFEVGTYTRIPDLYDRDNAVTTDLEESAAICTDFKFSCFSIIFNPCLCAPAWSSLFYSLV
jgi:hypothetical protein